MKPDVADDSSCGCRVPGARRRTTPLAAWTFLALVLAIRSLARRTRR
jgi:hypothetical protein